MTAPPKPRDDVPRVFYASGNHRTGYVGAIRAWSCDHRHPTTEAARDCARRYALTEIPIGASAEDRIDATLDAFALGEG